MTQVIATSRNAGRNVLHTVSAVYQDGSPAPVYSPQRRSAHRYDYAICHWTTIDGQRAVVVDRWSRTARAGADKFAVQVQHA